MSKPVGNLPTWATDAGALVVEPTALQKGAGYVPGDKPRAQNLNWTLRELGKWIGWVNELDSTLVAQKRYFSPFEFAHMTNAQARENNPPADVEPWLVRTAAGVSKAYLAFRLPVGAVIDNFVFTYESANTGSQGASQIAWLIRKVQGTFRGSVLDTVDADDRFVVDVTTDIFQTNGAASSLTATVERRTQIAAEDLFLLRLELGAAGGFGDDLKLSQIRVDYSAPRIAP